ncbi:MAG: alpha-glucosidase C-terminal domain-containing protein [Bacteroidales bacterium]|nr:alpha-glucosidase C-terminal domain-containing protein [Bacteroidales bacterium]
MKETDILRQSWHVLYNETHEDQLTQFLHYLDDFRNSTTVKPQEPEWYKDAIVYSLYVDLFNTDFGGLTEKLDYLQNLGVTCLWLLPILDSPMRDAGFDIREYTKVRDELLGLPAEASDEEKRKVFSTFLDEAHKRNLRVIFDIAMNHTSDQHPWFQESRKGSENPYRDYYIWNKDTNRYTQTRLLFKGMENSNWEKDGEWFYFHRFFGFQPDLNYRNPKVLTEMSKNLLFWLGEGVDGFRADAIPYLWKEEGTDCENLPLTHTIVKFFRAVLDYIRPNTLLLAEACQKPVEVVKYFGDGDECHAGYHFPLMPQIFKAIAMQNNEPIRKTLSKEVTPEIPENAQWFTFLRCHDELSLELVYVSEEDRAYIHKNYCHKPEWDFRMGEGISARLSELMDRNPEKIALAYSVMLTLPGTPIIYYGDEFGKLNDEDYYREKIKETGKDDTRFLVRGKIDWEQLEFDLNDLNSLSRQVFAKISNQLRIRKQYKAFGRGSIQWIGAAYPDGKVDKHILAYIRKWSTQRLLIIQNLSSETQTFKLNILPEISWIDMFGNYADYNEKELSLTMKPFEYLWLKL